jgi:fucose permease
MQKQSKSRLLFFTLCLAYVATGIVTILPGPSLVLIAKHVQVPLDVAGWAFTSSSLGFTGGVLLAGVISKRFGPKVLLMCGMVTMGAMALIVPWTHSYILLLASEFMLGIGFSFVDVSVNVIVTMAFHDVLGETMNNLHSTFGFGALIGPLLLSLALQTVHDPVWAFAVGTVIAFATFALLISQHIPRYTKSNETVQAKEVHRTVAHNIFLQAALWLMALQLFLYVGAEVSFGDWITTAVSQGALVSLVIAAPAATLFWLGLTVGRLLGAQAIRHGLLNEKQLLYISFIGGGTMGLLVAAFPGLLWLGFGGSLLVGFFFGPIFPSVMTLASSRFVHALDTVSSVMFFSAGASGIAIPVMVGILIAHEGISWGMAVPALICLLILVPFVLAMSKRLTPPDTATLQSSDDVHTMEKPATISQTQ